MSNTRRTEKTVETHEVYVIRPGSGALPELCSQCATGNALLIAPEQAALVAGVPVRTVYQWVETAMVHYKETQHGSIVVCIRSLPISVDPLK